MLEKDTKALTRPSFDEDLSDVSVVLSKRGAAFLERLTAQLREKAEHDLETADVVRALVDALAFSNLDETIVAAMYKNDSAPEEDYRFFPPEKKKRAMSAYALRNVLVELFTG